MVGQDSTAERKVALITGASAGLGERFAHLFAADKHDVILVARNQTRLDELATKLSAAHGVACHVIPADLADANAPERLFAAVGERGLSVEYLVNNAGLGTHGSFVDLPLEQEVGMIEVNVTALVKLTHRFGRAMAARGSGHILNIASTAGFQAGPWMSTYYASKAFVITFSEGIAHELKDRGVRVTVHCPGATATEFSARAGNDKTRLFQRGGVASAEDVAQDAYRAMMRGEVLRVHGLSNRVGALLAQVSPRGVVTRSASAFNAKAE